MRKEDYLTTQINQLGYVLKRILEKLTGTKSNDQLGVVWVVDNFKLKEKLGFDLAILDTISDENLIPFLITKEGFNDSNIELFADVLVKIDKEKYAKKAL
ncbi:hypothetical protein, partial [Flavobacterium psychrophilum]